MFCCNAGTTSNKRMLQQIAQYRSSRKRLTGCNIGCATKWYHGVGVVQLVLLLKLHLYKIYATSLTTIKKTKMVSLHITKVDI